MNTHFKQERGFTFLQAILVIALGLIIIAAVTVGYSYAKRAAITDNQSKDTQNSPVVVTQNLNQNGNATVPSVTNSPPSPSTPDSTQKPCIPSSPKGGIPSACPPALSSTGPLAGLAGDPITIFGTFWPTDNTALLSNSSGVVAKISSLNSPENKYYDQIGFKIPDISPGMYSLTVQNKYGTSNALPFTVKFAALPVISSLSPSTGSEGTLITMKGSGFTWDSSVTGWGSLSPPVRSVSDDGTSLTFPVPQVMNSQSYTVNLGVQNGNKSSNSIPFNVAGRPTQNAPFTINITPYQGPQGTLVTLHGTGFASSGNDIVAMDSLNKSQIIATNLSSTNNGTSVTFSIPSTLQAGSYYYLWVQDQGLGDAVYAAFDVK